MKDTRIPKVGEVWTYSFEPRIRRIVTITKVYQEHSYWCVRFRTYQGNNHNWLLNDFIRDAVPGEEYIVDQVLNKYLQ